MAQEMTSTITLSPHQMLANRIISLAIIDARSKNNLRSFAATWFLFGPDTEGDFEFWCSVLGLPMGRVREWARNKLEKRRKK